MNPLESKIQSSPGLTPEQPAALKAISEYLTETPLPAERTEGVIQEPGNLWRPVAGCLPAVEVDDHLVKPIRRVIANSGQQEIPDAREGGLVREVVGLPDGFEVPIVDRDVEDADPQDLQLSPLDGELCHRTHF